MTAQRMTWTGTIGAMLAIGVACAPQAGSGPGAPFVQGIPLPAGSLGNITRAELEALARTITWVGCDTALRAGWPGGTTTNVEICAAQYARDVGRGGNSDSNGLIVARMVNRGANYDARWGIMPGGTAYMASFLRSYNRGRYVLLEVPPGGFPGTKVNVLVDDGNLIYCQHTSWPATSSAKFATCEQMGGTVSHQGGAEHASGPSEAADAPLRELEGPAWVTCRTGCCTSDPQQQ